MVNIKEINDKELLDRIEDHQKKGGVLRINVFEVQKNYLGQFPDEYTAHLVAARQTLERQNYKWNLHFNKIAEKDRRNTFPFASTDFHKLDPSGQKIDLKHFLGPQYDLKKNKPIIRGQLPVTMNSYFYYDQIESDDNKVDFKKLEEEYEELYPSERGRFIRALLDPPYSLKLDREILKRGEYVLDFMNYFFGDLQDIVIYSWNTDCSVIFDAGKEWWGSYFWTIFNPSRQWYIGIIASETD